MELVIDQVESYRLPMLPYSTYRLCRLAFTAAFTGQREPYTDMDYCIIAILFDPSVVIFYFLLLYTMPRFDVLENLLLQDLTKSRY